MEAAQDKTDHETKCSTG